MRKHLDDEQRNLLQAELRADDDAFKVLANEISAGAKTLNQQIGDVTKIDSIINLASEIAAALDQALKMT